MTYFSEWSTPDMELIQEAYRNLICDLKVKIPDGVEDVGIIHTKLNRAKEILQVIDNELARRK
jgi:hypothetical protein